MIRLLPLILIIASVTLLQCTAAEEPPAESEPDPIPRNYGLASDTAGFVPFADSLMRAIRENDTSFVFAHTSEEVLNGFGYNQGIEAFRRIWSEPGEDMGEELAEALRLGVAPGNRGGDTDRYIYAPSHFVHFPDTLDPYRYFWVLEDSLPVHREPAASAPVETTYTGELIRVEEWAVQSGSGEAGEAIWAQVSLTDGSGSSMEGFVRDDQLRSPLATRFWFENVEGTWMLMGWAQGD